MKFWKRITTVLLAAFMFGAAGLMSACGNNGGGGYTAVAGEIYVMYFEGGFGSKWLKDASDRYHALHPEITFKLVSNADLQSNASLLLESGKNLPDIMMTQNFNWQDNVQFGQLASLDDIYNKPVAKRGGQDVLLQDFIVGDYKAFPWTPAIPGMPTKHAWIIPWSENTTSLAYNDDLLHKTKKTDTTFWTAPPETETELKQFVDDINSTSAAGGYGGKSVKPFIWPGGAINWLTFIQTIWWAQYQGIGAEHPAGEGNWYEFWDFADSNVYKQSGLRESYRLLQDLFVEKGANPSWKNVPADSGALGTVAAEIEFIKGTAVMMPVGSWLEREMEDYLDYASAYPNMRANLKMMVTPAITGAKSPQINNAQVGDFMCIPEKAVNKELAKNFLLFLCQEDELLEFTKNTGMMRPFEYNPIELAPDHAWTTFQRSTISLSTDYDSFYEFSKAESPMYVFKKLSPYIPTISTVVGNNLSKTPQEVVDAAWKYADDGWASWLAELGL
ncbi:MAG: hypothetical protein LBS99_03455 [Clostridiales bacterium]|jgi:hypothetical protein|nr:hypothetical protein [Clostridiales bacterium]